MGNPRNVALDTMPEAGVLGLQPGMVVIRLEGTGKSNTPGANDPDSCDRVLIADQWSDLPDPRAALSEAARVLREDGMLLVVESSQSRTPFAKMVEFLERNTWTIHRHGKLGDEGYFIEASVTDESVQS